MSGQVDQAQWATWDADECGSEGEMMPLALGFILAVYLDEHQRVFWEVSRCPNEEDEWEYTVLSKGDSSDLTTAKREALTWANDFLHAAAVAASFLPPVPPLLSLEAGGETE